MHDAHPDWSSHDIADYMRDVERLRVDWNGGWHEAMEQHGIHTYRPNKRPRAVPIPAEVEAEVKQTCTFEASVDFVDEQIAYHRKMLALFIDARVRQIEPLTWCTGLADHTGRLDLTPTRPTSDPDLSKWNDALPDDEDQPTEESR